MLMCVDGWLQGKDTADVPLGLETSNALCVSCQIRDKRPEEEEEDLKLTQRSKTLLRTRLGETILGSMLVFSLFQFYHKTLVLAHT